MAPILYYCDMSPPSRAVLLTAQALELELDLNLINLMEKEHLTEDFIKMNPQHCIPTLDDDGFYLWDSHAIAAYLVNKYAEDDSLYPKDPQQRATVDQRLNFDSNVLAPTMGAIMRAILFQGQTSVPEEQLIKILEAYGFLEAFLDGHDWMAGDNVTIADLCLLASVSSVNAAIPIDENDFPKLAAWLEKCTELPYYNDANAVGLEKLTAIYKTKMAEA